MEQSKLQQRVTFYDPHPGFAGAILPLPQPMHNLARELDGQSMTLEEAMSKIAPVAKSLRGEVEIVEDMNYIGFEFSSGISTNSYRLIRYK